MTISVPGSSKRGLAGFFSRKKKQAPVKPTARKQLDGAQVARLFDKTAQPEAKSAPGELQTSEIKDRDEISSLRGALYSRK